MTIGYIQVTFDLPIEIVKDIELKANTTGWSKEDLCISILEKEFGRHKYTNIMKKYYNKKNNKKSVA